MMKLSKLKTAITVLSGIFIFSLPFINDTSIVKAAWDDGYSDDAKPDPKPNDPGRISATFIDKSATSDTRFRTMGYTITINDPDTGEVIGHTHVAFDGKDYDKTSPDGTQKLTKDYVSGKQMQAAFHALVSDGDKKVDDATADKLYQQYLTGSLSLKLDSIIAVTTDNFKTKSVKVYWDDNGYAHYNINSDYYATYMKKHGDTNGDGVFSVSERDGLESIFTNTNFDTHYNKKLVLKNTPTPDTKEAEEAQAKIEEASKSVETEKFAEYHTWDNQSGTDGVARSSSSPYYVTYNDSRKYSENGKSHEAFTNETTDLMVCIFLLKIKKI